MLFEIPEFAPEKAARLAAACVRRVHSRSISLCFATLTLITAVSALFLTYT
jgi:hypothetical protein